MPRVFNLLPVIFFFIPIFVSGQKQGQAKIDSALKKLSYAIDDTNKVKLLSTLSADYSNIDPNKGVKYGELGLALAEKLGWQMGIARANLVIGNNWYGVSDYQQALKYDVAAWKIAEQIGDKLELENAIAAVGGIYLSQADYPKAIQYFSRALELARQLNNKSGIASEVGDLGLVYYMKSDMPNALEYNLEALRMFEALGKKESVADANMYIGCIYYELSEYTKALDYFDRSLKIQELLGNKVSEADVLTRIGNVYSDLKESKKALEYFIKALKIHEGIGDKYGAGYIMDAIGSTYVDEGEYATALGYFVKELPIHTANGDRYGMAFVRANLGNAYLGLSSDTAKEPNDTERAILSEMGTYIPRSKAARLKLAISYLEESLDSGMKMGSAQVKVVCYNNLSRAYECSGNYKKSLEAFQKCVALQDSQFSKDNERKMLQSSMQYDYDKRQLADSLKTLAKENIATIKYQQQRRISYISITGTILLLFSLFFVIRNYYLLNNEKKRSDNLVTEKERILQVVAHDLRSPMGAIVYLSDAMTTDEDFLPAKESFSLIKSSAQSCLNLINELMGFVGKQGAEGKEAVDLGVLIKESVKTANFKAGEKKQTILVEAPTAPVVTMANREELGRVLNNLLNNAIKFSHEGGVITVRLTKNHKKILLSVKDNGIGIPDNLMAHLFETFTPSKRAGTGGEKSFGLGLSIVNNIVTAHHGKVWVESTAGTGSIFFVELDLVTGE